MTPFEITVFLHHATCAAPFERADASIYPETMERMIADGLFIKFRSNDHSPYILSLTEKGSAFLRMLCDTPLPEAKFTDPRFDAALAEG